MTVMTQKITLMEQEAREAPAVIARQADTWPDLLTGLAARHREKPFRMVATCARGSSDHAASYGKYLIETQLGLPVMSCAPSIGSIYAKTMNFDDCLFILVSQSGQSPDIVSCAKWAKDNGAYVLALVNAPDSAAEKVADLTLPLLAGPEHSVAATKSYIASLAAFLRVVAALGGDVDLQKAIDRLPEDLALAMESDWKSGVDRLSKTDSLLVLGRGIGLGIAQEAALKFKETSAIHAEAFSSAEVMHGPLALIQPDFPVLAFTQADETETGMQDILSTLRAKGADVFDTGSRLPITAGMHPATAGLAQIQRFYLMVNAVSVERGFDPDNPQHLKKVTETL